MIAARHLWFISLVLTSICSSSHPSSTQMSHSSSHLEYSYGKGASDLRAQALSPTVDGARAALQSFYFAFNHRSIEALESIWADDPLISLNNPVGGIIRGLPDIRALYARIFDGPAQVWVELYDIVEYASTDTVVFAGRERGEFLRDGTKVALHIRTTRIFRYLGADRGWRQVHHHGSIDDAGELARYQRAVRGESTPSAPLVFVLNIRDSDTYREYRERIAPIMSRYGVGVRAEYQVAATLHSVTSEQQAAGEDQVNRLAVFQFPTEAVREAFFKDPEYLAAKPLLERATLNITKLVP
jgi:uncharacterized protein (DUF1330 family)/ketosteroid isomerase-like protein